MALRVPDTDEDWRALHEIYAEGASLLDCALLIGWTASRGSGIADHFRRLGLEVRSAGGPSKPHNRPWASPTKPSVGVHSTTTLNARMLGHRRRGFASRVKPA